MSFPVKVDRIKVSFLTYRDRSFTNEVNKSPFNFLILLVLSHLENKYFLRNYSIIDWINNHILSKEYVYLNLIPAINKPQDWQQAVWV